MELTSLKLALILNRRHICDMKMNLFAQEHDLQMQFAVKVNAYFDTQKRVFPRKFHKLG